MKRLLIASILATLASGPYQSQAGHPRHMPPGARICRECGGDGRVRCGFLYLDSKRCLDCDGRGYLLPPPPPPPKPHHVQKHGKLPPPPKGGKPGPVGR